MAKPKPNYDNDQISLPFDDEPEAIVVALKQIDWKETGLATAHQWNQVKELAMAIHVCGRIYGCHASSQQLLKTANKNRSKPLIGSIRTMQKVLRNGFALGIIRRHQQGPHNALSELVPQAIFALRDLNHQENGASSAHENGAPSAHQLAQSGAASAQLRRSYSSLSNQEPRTKKPRTRRWGIRKLPPELDNDTCREAIAEWIEYRGGKYKPSGEKKFLTRAAMRVRNHGRKAFLTALERAMANSWQGWDFDSSFQTSNRPQSGTGRFDPQANLELRETFLQKLGQP